MLHILSLLATKSGKFAYLQHVFNTIQYNVCTDNINMSALNVDCVMNIRGCHVRGLCAVGTNSMY
jgi:hypothetical protein